MGLPIHTIDVVPGSSPTAQPDRVIFAILPGVANVAGSGAGAAVVTAVGGLQLPANYTVEVTPNQDAVPFVSGKTQSGFNVTLNPRLAANTLAAGTFDVTIFA